MWIYIFSMSNSCTWSFSLRGGFHFGEKQLKGLVDQGSIDQSV